MRRYLSALLLCTALAGCALAPSRAPVSAPAGGPGANDNLNAVAWTQNAVERDLVYLETWRSAQDRLLAALADPTWDALPAGDRAAPAAGLPPAVIVDVDETVLDNSPYQARLVRSGGSFNAEDWAAWCREQRARAVPGAVAFAQFAAGHGITIVYLSNRAQTLDTATLANLRQVGLPVAGPDVFLGLGTVVDGCTQVGSAKGCRRQAVSRRYRVLMQVGDQLGDFVDAPQATLASYRATADRDLPGIGTRWFVLPNPTYGAWEAAASAAAPGASAAQRRKARIDALRYD
jgi:acid phosphatase